MISKAKSALQWFVNIRGSLDLHDERISVVLSATSKPGPLKLLINIWRRSELNA